MSEEIIFLGAGASKDAGVPLAGEMSIRLAALFNEKEAWHILQCDKEAAPIEPYCRAFHFALGGLLSKLGAAGTNPFNGVDVEELFNVIEALSRRNDLEISPFVTWNAKITSVENFPSSQGEYAAERFCKRLREIITDSINAETELNPLTIEQVFDQSKEQLVGEFHDAISLVSGKSRQYWAFTTTLDLMKRLLGKIVWITDPDKVRYLEPLLRYCSINDVAIASVNYDNAIELCAKSLGIQIDNGMEELLSMGKIVFRKECVPLIRLHGAIDWSLSPLLPLDSQPAPQVSVDIEQIKDPEQDFKFTPAIIFGQRNKLTADGPFLDLFRCFEERLQCSEKVTVIGYSFRDAHINTLLSRWLNRKASRYITVINGPDFKLEEVTFFSDEHIPFLEKRFRIVKEYASTGIKKMFGSTS